MLKKPTEGMAESLHKGAVSAGQQKEYCQIQIKSIDAEIMIFEGQVAKVQAGILNLLLQRKTFEKELKDIAEREKIEHREKRDS